MTQQSNQKNPDMHFTPLLKGLCHADFAVLVQNCSKIKACNVAMLRHKILLKHQETKWILQLFKP